MSLQSTLAHYAKFSPSSLSLPQMARFGVAPTPPQLFRSSQFINTEMPIRLAHRVKDLENLPDGLSDAPSIVKVRGWYERSFEDLLRFRETQEKRYISDSLRQQLLRASSADGVSEATIGSKPVQSHSAGSPISVDSTEDPADRLTAQLAAARREWPPEVTRYNAVYASLIASIRRRHDGVVLAVAQGIQEHQMARKRAGVNWTPSDPQIQRFLDRFYATRIGIRFLLGQHVAIADVGLGVVRGPRLSALLADGYIGQICIGTPVAEITANAVQLAQTMCEEWYGLSEAPPVELVCDPNLRFMYIPSHLAHMVFEIVKNALRAEVEKAGKSKKTGETGAGLRVVVADGGEDITLKVSDTGGGISRSHAGRVFEYMFTTVSKSPTVEQGGVNMMGAPLAGFGYGLPISRLYARYFGGDIQLVSLEGYATDVYIHLPKLSTSNEFFVA